MLKLLELWIQAWIDVLYLINILLEKCTVGVRKILLLELAGIMLFHQNIARLYSAGNKSLTSTGMFCQRQWSNIEYNWISVRVYCIDWHACVFVATFNSLVAKPLSVVMTANDTAGVDQAVTLKAVDFHFSIMPFVAYLCTEHIFLLYVSLLDAESEMTSYIWSIM